MFRSYATQCILALASALLLLNQCNAPNTSAPSVPNVVIVLADDLGYGELGCFGQQIIETPNIDRLAQSGMRFTNHYSGAAVCAPSRCVLLTGKHTGHAFIRGNDEWRERGDVWNYLKVYDDPSLEGQRPLPGTETTLGEVMQRAAYRTGFVGKWGLGAPGSEGAPEVQGFDYFYGYNCQRQAHTLYPGHLWENGERIYLSNALVAPHSPLSVHADSTVRQSYARKGLNEYAPELIHRKALEFLERSADEPFFLVYASPLPHLPLQAPEKWIAHYERKIAHDPPYTGHRGYFPCFSPRATYAAMISTLDEQLGELVQKLDKLNLRDNTLILFTSDNGPTYTGGADTRYFRSASPFEASYGRGKGFLYEGGIRVPLIASWPGMIAKGTTSTHICGFQDYWPTIAEITGAQTPADADGLSFAPTLFGGQQSQHLYLFWEQPEYNGQMAVRQNEWKGIIANMHAGNAKMELYNLDDDPEEQIDLSSRFPDKVLQLREIMQSAHERSSIPRFHFPQDSL